MSDLAQCGYDAEWQIISAEMLGAKHLRKRIWIVAYPDATRLQNRLQDRANRKDENDKQEGVRPAVLSSIKWPRDWNNQPCLGGRIHGISHRVDRLKALGNAIVPQCAYVSMKLIDNAIEENKLLCYKKTSK